MAYYEDFEKIDKICPLLSSKQVVKDDGVLYCLGENCMWFQNYCKPKSITILPNLEGVKNVKFNEKDPEPWTYWKLFYGRKKIDTKFGQYIKCGYCGFEMPFEWVVPYDESRADILPKECPHCHTPVRMDQTCGGVKRG